MYGVGAMKLGKRFIFATIAIIFVSFTAIALNFTGKTYMVLVSSITGIFIVGQSITDRNKNGKD